MQLEYLQFLIQAGSGHAKWTLETPQLLELLFDRFAEVAVVEDIPRTKATVVVVDS